MKIGLDCDGVILDSQSFKPIAAREMFGIDIPLKFFSRERIVERGLSIEQYERVKARVYEGDFDNRTLPVSEAVLYIRILLGERNQIKVITSRDGRILQSAITIMSRHSINLPVTGLGYEISKMEACQGLDLYVDDDLDKLVPLIGIVSHLLLFSWPFNQHEQVPRKIVRVSSWWEIYNYIHYEM